MQPSNSEADSSSEPHDDPRRTAKSGRVEGGAPRTAAPHETPQRSPRAGSVTSPAGEITFPKFDRIADDPDDRPVGPKVGARAYIPERAGAVRGRTRTPWRWLVPVLLLAVVLLLAPPSFVWLRNYLNRPSANPATPAAVPAASASADKGRPPGRSAPTTTTGAANVPGAVAGKPTLSTRTAPPPSTRTPPPSSAGTTGARPAPAAPRREAGPDGLISLLAPVITQVFADGKPVGTMERGVIKLPAGRHNLEFVNDEMGYRASQSITVTPSQTTQVRLDAPPGTLSINAVPWAEVLIDNSPAGQTPIGNIRVPIGRREVVLRHPDYGERRFTVLVTLKQTARVSTDFTRR